MAAFARARTKSWLNNLWPERTQPFKNKEEYLHSKELDVSHVEQNKRFLQSIKNGGIWFS